MRPTFYPSTVMRPLRAMLALICLFGVSSLSADPASRPAVPESAPAASQPAQASAPTAVSDRPTTGPTRIVVKWVAETAVDNFGYNVYRTDELTTDTEWTKLNKRILPGIGTTSIPTVLRYMDDTVGPDLKQVWHYKVEEISTDGSRIFFEHPVTGERPFILSGRPKVISDEERERFAEGRFLREMLER